VWGDAEKFLRKDKYIGPLIAKYGPCELVPKKKSQYMTRLVAAICGQQLSVKAAATIFSRVENRLEKITPDNVLAASDEDLRACGLSRAKTAYVKDLATRVVSNELKIKALDRLPEEEVMRELVAVKGIGKWTAEMFLMFTLARGDIFPVDDLGIRNGMKILLRREMTSAQMEKFAERWKPYRSVASWYIWELLDNKP